MDFQSQTKNNVERELRFDIASAKAVDKGILHLRCYIISVYQRKLSPVSSVHSQSPVLCDGGLQKEDKPWQR